jgi:hypothetical protein
MGVNVETKCSICRHISACCAIKANGCEAMCICYNELKGGMNTTLCCNSISTDGAQK